VSFGTDLLDAVEVTHDHSTFWYAVMPCMLFDSMLPTCVAMDKLNFAQRVDTVMSVVIVDFTTAMLFEMIADVAVNA
jgi:hypothetical protein